MSSDHALELDARRRELGEFMRSRRERLEPATVGLPSGFRRRTPGLRREEVALLAGVGTTWYTWLEQGRDVSPSPGALAAIANALRLNGAERKYLFTLGGRSAPESQVEQPEQVPESIKRMLHNMSDQPAYVLGRRWDVLAWNEAAVAVFGDFGRLEGDARNLVHMMFANPSHRRLMIDWNDLAPLTVAMFRADSARYAGNADFARLIALLNKESPEFRDWWPRRDVLYRPSTVKRIRHPSGEERVFEYVSLDVSGCAGMRLVVCTAQGPSNPRQKKSAGGEGAPPRAGGVGQIC